MKILFFLVFIGLSFIMIYKNPYLIDKKKIAFYYGIGILIGFLFLIISASCSYYFQRTNNFTALNIFDNYILKISWSVLTIFFVAFFVNIVVEYIISFILGFHQKYNEVNLDRNPLKFVKENKNSILIFIKLIFFLFGQCLPLYGIWFGKN
jgi:hypothetical protein